MLLTLYQHVLKLLFNESFLSVLQMLLIETIIIPYLEYRKTAKKIVLCLQFTSTFFIATKVVILGREIIASLIKTLNSSS